MTQEDKALLLKDLCARLPYGLKYNYGGYNSLDYTMNHIDCNAVDCAFPIENIKPYLFPLPSISNKTLKNINAFVDAKTSHVIMDFFNSHHIDYRGLIEKGLAIDATNLNIY